MSRALGSTNLRMDIFNTFENLAKTFRKTPVTNPLKSPDQFKIVMISYQYKETIQELDDSNIMRNVFIDKTFSVYGYEQILEYISLPKLRGFYNTLGAIFKDFTKEMGSSTITVVNALSGGYVLQSALV